MFDLLAGTPNNIVQCIATAEWRALQRPIRQKHECGSPHGKHVGTFIDACTQLELLGGHETRQTEHAPHLVREWPVMIGVQVYDV